MDERDETTKTKMVMNETYQLMLLKQLKGELNPLRCCELRVSLPVN